jgi:DNA primase
MLNILQLYKDHNIEYATEGTKHTRAGWVQTSCPFCYGSPGYHLGFSLNANIFNCYRCGRHPKTLVIKNLLHISWNDAKNTIDRYSITNGRSKYIKQEQQYATSTNFPEFTSDISTPHILYLKKRGFDHNTIRVDWGIKGTCHLGEYKQRIIIPIYMDEILVSYQGRDITGKQDPKYKACSIPLETLHHKDLLYGIDNVSQDKIIVCEGVMDVWRVGYGAVCTFGVSYTKKQLLLLSQFKEIGIAFDMDSPGREAAKQLQKELSNLGCHATVFEYDGYDPDTAKKSDIMEMRKWIQ